MHHHHFVGDEEVDSRPMNKFTKWRNIVGFWILGLANSYPYVVMLSAALDIIRCLSGDLNDQSSDSSRSEYEDSCTPVNGTYQGREHCDKDGTPVCVCGCVCVPSPSNQR